MTFPANSLFLAPLAGYTRYPFRILAQDAGAYATITEMVNVRGLYEHYTKTELRAVGELIYTSKLEENVGIQLFGNSPQYYELAAKEIEDRGDFKFININMGCPKSKVTKVGNGAALLQNLENVSSILDSLTKSTQLPITVKARLGYRHNNIKELIKVVENYDVEWLMVHTRLASENYTEPAHKEQIKEICALCSLPIIANGDVFSKQDVEEYVSYGAKGVAIGRWAMGDPFVFDLERRMSIHDHIKQFDKFIELNSQMNKDLGIKTESTSFVKTFAINIVKGYPYSRIVKQQLHKTKTIDELKDEISNYLHGIANNDETMTLPQRQNC